MNFFLLNNFLSLKYINCHVMTMADFQKLWRYATRTALIRMLAKHCVSRIMCHGLYIFQVICPLLFQCVECNLCILCFYRYYFSIKILMPKSGRSFLSWFPKALNKPKTLILLQNVNLYVQRQDNSQVWCFAQAT